MGADSALSLHSMRNFDPATVLQHNRRAHSSLSGGGTVGGGVGGVGGGGGRLLNSVAGLGSIPPRSWHPSPLASDEENMSNLSAHSAASLGGEPAFYKEEKKNKIKMEIARRRQQIEENACLHEELTRLARLRENAEYGSSATAAATARLGNSLGGGNPLGGLMNAGLAGTQPSALAGAAAGGTGVLKSVDEILRDPFAPASSAAAARTTAGLGLTSALPAGGAGAAAGLYGASAGMGGLSSAADLLAARTTANSVGISAADPLLTGGVGVNSALLNSTADMSDLAHARRLTASAAGHMASAAGSLGLASNPAAAASLGGVGGVSGVGGLVNSDPYSRSAAISAGVYR